MLTPPYFLYSHFSTYINSRKSRPGQPVARRQATRCPLKGVLLPSETFREEAVVISYSVCVCVLQ